MPRARKKTRYVRWNITVPATTSAAVQLLLYSPAHERATYGARAALINALLERWVQHQDPSIEFILELTAQEAKGGIVA